jgi:hypothetical protein
MPSSIPVLRLEHVLDRLGASAIDEAGAQSAIAMVNSVRDRENALLRFLPRRLLRRFDRGFARSYTVHPDTARALYGITRAMRSDVVLETGTYWGYSTTVLAAAVRDAGVGMVHSFDLYPKAGAHIPMSLRPWVQLHLGRPASETMPSLLAGVSSTLFFQDSVHDYDGVLAELNAAVPALAPGAVVLFHDFVLPDVRRAAVDGLPRWFIAQIDVEDQQQLGIGIAPRA